MFEVLGWEAGKCEGHRGKCPDCFAAVSSCLTFQPSSLGVFRLRDMDKRMEWERLFYHPSSLITFFGLSESPARNENGKMAELMPLGLGLRCSLRSVVLSHKDSRYCLPPPAL